MGSNCVAEVVRSIWQIFALPTIDELHLSVDVFYPPVSAESFLEIQWGVI